MYLIFCLFSWDSVSLYSVGYPASPYINQGVLKPIDVFLPVSNNNKGERVHEFKEHEKKGIWGDLEGRKWRDIL